MLLNTVTAALACLSLPVVGAHATGLKSRRDCKQLSLPELAMREILSQGSPVFGHYQSVKSNTSEWMKAHPDSTLLVHMNIPGAHDAQTWNYSQATREQLLHINEIGGKIPRSSDTYRCQERSVVDMLNAGVRAFDLRYAFDVTNSVLVFWHGPALVSQTATLADTMFGFYKWLDDHPSEALLLSFQYEGGTTKYAANDATVQRALYDILTSRAAKKYILQTKDSFGTLGEARGKITLIRRFTMDRLDASYEASLPGVHFSPSDWTDNGQDITLVYNREKNGTAHIEDYYEPEAPKDSTPSYNIGLKYNATTANILRAASDAFPNDLFWSFASSRNIDMDPPLTPRIMALGNGTVTPSGGVNQQLLPFLQGLKGKRVGIVMVDFENAPGNLIDTILSL